MAASAMEWEIEFHPLTVALGAIKRKPAMLGDRVEPREFLE